MREYTMNEVSRHCTAEDLWLVVDGKVCDMTSYFKMHPGGLAMLRQAGKDASIAIRTVNQHGIPWKFIEKKLDELCIGTLSKRQ